MHRPLLLALRGGAGAAAGRRAGALVARIAGARLVAGRRGARVPVLALTFATPVLLTAATLDLGLRLASRGVAAPMLEVVRPWLGRRRRAGRPRRGVGGLSRAWLRAWPMQP